MEHVIEFIENWGYFAVLFGAIIEGESIILTSVYLAYKGILDFNKVVIIAFIGTLFADWTLYLVGRHFGPGIIRRNPKLHVPADKAFKLLKKWDIWFILSFRFIYGIRAISPIVIGASGILPRRFIPLNFLAAVIWTGISCYGGYYLAGAVDDMIGTFQMAQKYVIFAVIGLITFVSVAFWAIRRYLFKVDPDAEYDPKEHHFFDKNGNSNEESKK